MHHITRLVNKAIERENEDRAFMMYLEKYAWMDEETFVTFDDFYKPSEKNNEERTAENILKELKESMDKYGANKVIT